MEGVDKEWKEMHVRESKREEKEGEGRGHA